MSDMHSQRGTAETDPRVITEHLLTDYVRQASSDRTIADTIDTTGDNTRILHPGDRVVLEYTISFENQTVTANIASQYDVTHPVVTEIESADTTRFFVECYVEERTGADKVTVTGAKVIGYNITSEGVEKMTTTVRRDS